MAEQKNDAHAGEAVSPPRAGSPVRLVVRVILFGILAYLLCALPYDFLVARAGEERAWNELQTMLDEINTKAGRPNTTDETVHEKLGRSPSATTKDKLGYTQETYSWRGGLPWRKYNIYVTYYPSRGKLILENAHRNETPDKLTADLPKGETKPATANASAGPPTIGTAGGMPGDGRGPGGGPGGIRPPGGAGRPGGGPPGGAGRQPPTRPEAEAPAEEPSDEAPAKKPNAEDAAQETEPEDAAKPKDAPEKPSEEAAEKSPE